MGMANRSRRPPFGMLSSVVAGVLVLGACSPLPASPAPSTIPGSPAGPTSLPTGPVASFSCAYPLTLSGAAGGVQLTAVRLGTHPETTPPSDRIVFEFAGSAVPSIEIQRAAPAFVHDASGLPLDVPGSAFLRIVVRGATGAGTYTGPVVFDPGSLRLTALRQAGDFEGVLTWIAGSPTPVCARIQVLSAPARLVVDLVM